MLALTCVLAIALDGRKTRVVGAVLALLWAWMALAYHFAFFAAINPAAWGFGAVFRLGSAALAWHSWRGSLVFGRTGGARGLAGGALVAYALVGYPVLGGLLGARYPAVPTFGLPCPTTIFTLGLLLFAVPPVPRIVFVVPLLWSCIGAFAAFAAFARDVKQDLGLVVAAVLALPALFGTGGCARRGGTRP